MVVVFLCLTITINSIMRMVVPSAIKQGDGTSINQPDWRRISFPLKPQFIGGLPSHVWLPKGTSQHSFWRNYVYIYIYSQTWTYLKVAAISGWFPLLKSLHNSSGRTIPKKVPEQSFEDVSSMIFTSNKNPKIYFKKKSKISRFPTFQASCWRVTIAIYKPMEP